MKNRFVVYGLLAIACGGVLGYLWLNPGVTIVGFFRIHSGMHATEVEDFFGGPMAPVERSGAPILAPNQGFIEYRRGVSGSNTIIYDVDARVVAKQWHWNLGILDDLFGPEIRE